MKSLVESIRTLAHQLDRLLRVPNPDELRQTINEFSSIMKEVMGFIQEWLEHWTRMYEFIRDGIVPDPSVPLSQVHPRCRSKGKSD